MNRAIVIGTTPPVDLETGEPSPWLPDLLASLKDCKYHICTIETWKYELSAMQLALEFGFDEFIFLPHSVMMKNQEVFDMAFSRSGSVSLCQTPCPFGMYLGKYRASVIRKIGLPVVENKMDAVLYESVWTKQYRQADKWSSLGDLPHTDTFEEKNGRLNMVVENKWFRKWKGSWDYRTMVEAMKEEKQ